MSLAFLPIGTRTTFAGLKLAEVRSIEIVQEGIRVWANFIPSDDGQLAVIEALQREYYAELVVVLPQGTTLTVHGLVSGKAEITWSKAASLEFTVNGTVTFSPQSVDTQKRLLETAGLRANA